MKKYWLYIESYSFLFVKNNRMLIYNTLDKKITPYTVSGTLSPLLTKLEKEKCISITEQQLAEEQMQEFVKIIRYTFNGDVIENTNNIRPAIFKPFVNNQREYRRVKVADKNGVSMQLMNYLEEIFIYLNGFPGHPAVEYHKQMPSYLHSEKSLDADLLSTFLAAVPDHFVNQVNLLGGNLPDYPYFEKVFEAVSRITTRICVYLKYTCLDATFWDLYADRLSKLHLLVPVSGMDIDKIKEIQAKRCGETPECIWTFMIESEEEYAGVEELIQQTGLTGCRIKPVFTGHNLDFFEKHIYWDEQDIEDQQTSKQDIYANQSINKNDFGRIYLLPDGSIHANLTQKRIGVLGKNSIIDVLHKEMASSKAWFNIRNKKPCCDCVYQWLCPSPSGYESVIGKPDLCHVK